MPAIVVCDPELTVGMPPRITAGTGMDAFSHCLEAYCAPGFHPLADGVAVEGMRLIASALPRVLAAPGDLAARADMMAAAAMGATAFQKGLGGMHALAHPIGALFDTHHGMTNATLMPYVLVHNRAAIESRIARLGAYLGLERACPSGPSRLPAGSAFCWCISCPEWRTESTSRICRFRSAALSAALSSPGRCMLCTSASGICRPLRMALYALAGLCRHRRGDERDLRDVDRELLPGRVQAGQFPRLHGQFGFHRLRDPELERAVVRHSERPRAGCRARTCAGGASHRPTWRS
jgi:hypothetical protein